MRGSKQADKTAAKAKKLAEKGTGKKRKPNAKGKNKAAPEPAPEAEDIPPMDPNKMFQVEDKLWAVELPTMSIARDELVIGTNIVAWFGKPDSEFFIGQIYKCVQYDSSFWVKFFADNTHVKLFLKDEDYGKLWAVARVA